MHIAMRNALTLAWNDLRLFLSDFTVSGAVWFLVGFFATITALSVLVMRGDAGFACPVSASVTSRMVPGVCEIDRL